MSIPTKLHALSDRELTYHLSEARSRSPVIEELCQRMEKYVALDKLNLTAVCPICESTLEIAVRDREIDDVK